MGIYVVNDHAVAKQPAPAPGEKVVLTELLSFLGGKKPALSGALVQRAEMGKERYGTYLMTCNDRDAMVDWLQEALDGSMYGYQYHIENPDYVVAYWLFLDQVSLAEKLIVLVNTSDLQRFEQSD